MGRPKKDAKYLNVYIRRDIYDKFSKFCSELGQSKTVAAERALEQYMKGAGFCPASVSKREEELSHE